MLTALGCVVDSAPLVILGFVGVGAMNGAVLLARTAAADMYPPERKARAISYVLFGALFGAALGPLVFRPLFAGKDLELDTLVIPWFAAAAMCARRARHRALRSGPIRERSRSSSSTPGPRPGTPDTAPAAPLGQILRRPGVPSAVIAALASFAVMASVMNLTGYIVVGHHHEQADVFTVISLHIVGMYALVLVVGQLVDRVGRRPSLLAGLAIMAVSTVMLAWVDVDPVDVALALPARARLELLLRRRVRGARARIATPVERGRLVGFTDLFAGLLAAALALARRAGVHGVGGRGARDRRNAAVVAPALAILFARRPSGGRPGTGRIGRFAATIRRRRTASPPSFCDEDVHRQAG